MSNDLAKMKGNTDLTGLVIGCAVEVHKILGPGMLESAYHRCFAREMDIQGIPYESKKRLPIIYKGELIESSFVPDFIVDGRLIVEVKAVVNITGIFKQQLMTYLKLTLIPVGLLINFNVMAITHGIKRVSRL